MKRTVLSLLALSLFAAPAVAGAEIVVRNLDVSIGIGSRAPRHEPHREVIYVDRKPDVVYVRDDDRDWRDDRRHHRRHHRDERHDRRWRNDSKVVVIDRDHRGHRCDDRGRVVVTRPGSVIVVADERRW